MADDRVLDSCTNLMFYHINTCVTTQGRLGELIGTRTAGVGDQGNI